MIIFLYGQDAYRSKEKLDEIVRHYKEVRKSALNLIYIDAKDISFFDFYDHFKISPMFAEKKLMIVKNVFLHKKFQEDFLEEVKHIQSFKDIIVVYESEVVDQRLKLFKVLLKESKSQEFTLLDAKNLRDFAQKKFEMQGQKINMDALSLLLNYVGNDLWQLSNEVKKLVNFRKGLVVKKEDVELLVRPKIEVDIFKTIDALAQKNTKQVLLFMQKHIDNGDDPLYLISMIAYQFRTLLMVKELAEKGLMYNSIVKKSGLHPFVVKKSYFACSKFSFHELKNIYKKTFQIDSDIKAGKIDSETALDMLVSSV